MSCPSSQNARNFTVSAGSLPEGYCPTTWQQFLNDLAARLLVTSPLQNSSFATGSTAPTSNVGPWLKDCAQWFFFDDATGLYKIQEKGGFNNLQVFNSSSSFVVPDNIYKIMTEGWGGGGGGCNTSGGSSQPGGGGGGYGLLMASVTPGQSINFTIGTGGSAGVPGSNGGDTSILTMVCGGGKGAVVTSPAALGGVTTGATRGVNGGSGSISVGGLGGTGGDAPLGGQGGRIDSATQVGQNGISPGGAGAGGTNSNNAGGTGAAGQILIWY